MISNTEKVRLMSGTHEDKKILFEALIAEITENGMNEGDVPMLEFLKDYFRDYSESGIVEMSANLNGQGAVS